MLGFDVKGGKEPTRIDREKVQKLLEKLGVASKRIEAEYVEIKTAEKIIRIKKPDILLTLLFGRDVYQVAGEVEEIPLKLSARELRRIMKETGKDEQEIVSRLAELNYDVTRAVSDLKAMKRSGKKEKA